MNEIYWIDGAFCEANGTAATLAQDTLNMLLEQTGIEPAWIDAVYWLGGDIIAGTTGDVGLENYAPILSWPGMPLLDHFILHSAARSLFTGDTGLVIMGQQIGGEASAVMMASPRAVEERQLKPRANLSARLMLSPAGSPLASIRQALENLHAIAPNALACIAPVDSDSLATLSSEMEGFNPTLRIEPAPAGVIMQLNVLANALQEDEAGCGVLVSALPHRPLLATLVQKV